jgi:hypothetical protein
MQLETEKKGAYYHGGLNRTQGAEERAQKPPGHDGVLLFCALRPALCALSHYACTASDCRRVAASFASGRVTVKLAPRPGPSLSAVMSPWWSSMM